MYRYTIAVLVSSGLLAACAERPVTQDTSGFTHAMPHGPVASTGSEPAPAPTQTITRYADQDRDGRVTREEAQVDPALARSFDHYDLDKSGALDRGEFARLEDESRNRNTESVPMETPVDPPRAEVAPQRDYWGQPEESLNRTGVDQIRSAPSE